MNTPNKKDLYPYIDKELYEYILSHKAKYSDDLIDVVSRFGFFKKYLLRYMVFIVIPIVILLNLFEIVIISHEYNFLAQNQLGEYLLNKNDGIVYGPAFISSYTLLLIYVLFVVIKFTKTFKKPYTRLIGTKSEKFKTIIQRTGHVIHSFIFTVIGIPVFGYSLFFTSADVGLQASTLDYVIQFGYTILMHFLMCLSVIMIPFRICFELNTYPVFIQGKYDMYHRKKSIMDMDMEKNYRKY